MIAQTSTTLSVLRGLLSGLFVVALLCRPDGRAEDWPQWRGPRRDGAWRETGIVDAIPGSGLKVRWRANVGRGYSGPSVADGRVFVTDQKFNPEVERVLCFDEATGEELWQYSYPCDYEHMEYGNGPRASPTVDEGKVYTLGTQGVLCCLEADTGTLLWQKDLVQEYDARVPRWGVAAAPLVERDVLIVMAGGQPDACVIAFDKNSGEERWKTLDDHPSYSAPIVVDRGGCRQVIVWTDDNINSLNPATGELYWQQRIRAAVDSAQVMATPVLHDDRLLLTFSFNRGTMMLQLAAEEPAASMLWMTRAQPSAGMATPWWLDDDHFCVFNNVGKLSCCDASNGDEVWTTDEVSGSGGIGHAHPTPNGDRVFFFNHRGQLISARVTPAGYEETGRTLLVEPTAGHRAQGPVTWSHPAYANKHVIARNDRLLVSASLDEEDYGDAPAGIAEAPFEVEVLSGFTGRDSAQSVDFAQDGQTLALGTWAGKVKLIDVATRTEKPAAPTGFRNKCSAVAFSPDDQLLAYVGGSEFKQGSNNDQSSGKVLLWNVVDGTQAGDFQGHTSNVTSVVWSPDGQTLATGSADQTIRLWDPTTGTTRAVLEGHTDAVWSLAYSPDGQTLTSASWDGTVKFWNPIAGTETATLNAHDEEILGVAVSPDGTTLATGSTDWTVRLWDIATREQRGLLEGHHGAVYCLAFSPDGQTLATGSGDETVKLWNVATATEQTTLRGHRSGIAALAFSPDNQLLISTGRDDPPRLWKLTARK